MNVEVQESFRSLGTKDRKTDGKKRLPKPTVAVPPEKLSRKDYERKLQKLQVELCYLQDWVRETGARVIIVCEGRDTAGKGGLIRRLTERVSPRTFRVVALSAPSERERTKLYPAAICRALPGRRRSRDLRSQLVQPRRRRAGHGLHQDEGRRTVPRQCPEVRDNGWSNPAIILIKLWLEVGKKEQDRRFKAAIEDPLRQWKLSPMDLKSYSRWYDYSRARDAMFEATDRRARALVRAPQRRQEARTPERHQAHPVADPLQADQTRQDPPAETIEQGPL